VLDGVVLLDDELLDPRDVRVGGELRDDGLITPDGCSPDGPSRLVSKNKIISYFILILT